MHFSTTMCAAFTVLAASVSATHKLGSSCGGKHIGTLGCSNDECTVIKCNPSGNGNHYWEFSESCIGIKCQNGACNDGYPKDSCSA
ncbi:hypothetical protein WHR41_05301 [Cladosporium halotolerans]|uniref:Uncharacterized protein n=1 Tax=Cladosporium halotolerans TaxID=1052096 RepID=A0AB34KNB9_9PEZI